MTKKKKLLIILIPVAVVVCAAAIILGVYFGTRGSKLPPLESQNGEPSLTLTSSEMTMDLYEETALYAQTENITGEIKWSSTDASVVSVEGGTLTAGGKTGTAVIKAEADGISDECTVTVQAKSIPVLSLSDEVVTLNKNFPDEEYAVAPTLLYNGHDITAGNEFHWSAADGAEEDIAEFSQGQNGAALFKPLKTGETKYQVYVTFGDTVLFGDVSVSVIELEQVLLVDGMRPAQGSYSVQLQTYGGTEQCSPAVEAYNLLSGQKQPLSVTWTLEEGEDCLQVSGNSFIALDSGTAKVKGTCAGYEDIIVNIEVIKPQYSLAGNPSYVFETRSQSAQSFSFADAGMVGEVKDVFYDGVSVLQSYNEGSHTLTLNGAAFPQAAAKLGAQSLIIETDKVYYSVPFTLYTRIIRQASELDALKDEAAVPGKTAQYDGYYVLGADIEYSGAGNILAGSNTAYLDGNQYGFMGVFDGDGHVISGFSSTSPYTSFFGITLHAKGTIKDVAFTDVSIGSTASVICVSLYGTLENIYIRFNSVASDANSSALCASWQNGAAPSIKNCFCDYSDFVLDAPNYYPTTKQYSSTHTVYCVANGNYKKSDANGASALNGTHYTGYLALMNDAAAERAIAGWDNEYWNTELKVPFPARLYDSVLADSALPITVNNPTETIDGKQYISVFDGEELSLNLDSYRYLAVRIPQEMAEKSFKVNGFVVSIPSRESVEGGVAGLYSIEVYSLFNENNKITVNIQVKEANNVLYNGGEAFEFDLDILIDESAEEGEKTAMVNENAKAEITLDADYGTIERILIDNQELSDLSGFSLAGNKLTIDAKQFGTATYGEKQLRILAVKDNTEYLITVNLLLISKRINNAEELADLSAYAYQGNYVWDGYFVLENDIDWSDGGDLFASKDAFGGNEDLAAEGALYGFKGVFDGRGHTIVGYDAKTHLGGFFGSTLGTGSVVKNVSFVHGKVTAQYAGFLSFYAFGSVENVYIQIDSVSDAACGAALAGKWSENAQASFKSCFIDYSRAQVHAPSYYPTTKQWVTSDTIYTLIGGSKGADWLDDRNGSFYADAASLAADSAAQKAFASWDAGFWSIENGVPCAKSAIQYLSD